MKVREGNLTKQNQIIELKNQKYEETVLIINNRSLVYYRLNN